MVTINIRVVNQLTNEVVVDSKFKQLEKSSFDAMSATADVIADSNPDCTVYIRASTGNFVSLMPRNQKADEQKMGKGLLSWEEYMAKWYKTSK